MVAATPALAALAEMRLTPDELRPNQPSSEQDEPLTRACAYPYVPQNVR